MNSIALVLARLIGSYFTSVKAGGVECRLVIPGLSEAIVEQIHVTLRSERLPSLLVIPETRQPSAADFKLRAEGLTSLRHGDMLITVWPGELSRIQDSIIGVGGTIRNFAFSDEWPWIDDGNEYFKFDGPFLEELLTLWDASKAERTWLKALILALVRTTRGSIWRSRVLLEDILGNFSSAQYSELPTLTERFLHHCGLPRPDGPAAGWQISELLKQAEALGKVVSAARLQVETRDDLLERVDEIESSLTRREPLHREVNGLLDGMARQAETRLVGLLALRGCWGDGVNRWQLLTLPTLRRLFDPTAEIKASLNVRATTEQGIVSTEGKRAVLFEHGYLVITAVYDGLKPNEVAAASVMVLQGARELSSLPSPNERDPVAIRISFDEIFRNSSKKRTLRVQLRVNDRVHAEDRIVVHPCGTNSPLIALLQPEFLVYAAGGRGADIDEAQRVELSIPVSVTILANTSAKDVALDIDGETVETEVDPSDQRILNLLHFIDPGTTPAGRVTLTAGCEVANIVLDLEASGHEQGEFTLERELVVRLAHGSVAKVERLIGVFAGTATQLYNELGGLTDLTRARSRYARCFEAPDSIGLPILADLLQEAPAADLVRRGWIITHPDTNANRLCDLTLDSRVKQLLDEYQSARNAVLAVVTQGQPAPEGRWPAYAWFPIFVERRQGKLEAALVDYLNAYSNVLTFLSRSFADLAWEECLLLSALDCVVHWGQNDPMFAKAFLLGPWHPLVVAKRYMVQSALLASARRFNAKRSLGFNRLALLLDQLNSFRWTHVVSPDGVSFEHAYVSATSDPGWLLAINCDSIDKQSSENLIVSLRRFLGLEAAILPLAREQMASAYLGNFLNAYPSRRAIALTAAPLYSGERIVESAASVLYSGEDLKASGRLLSGGLHLFLHDAATIEPETWRRPPICIYDLAAGTPWGKDHKDIYLLPPGKPRTLRMPTTELPLARGRLDLAAFSVPVRRVTVGARGIPNSYTFERDVEGRPGTSVGDTFVRCLHLAGQIGGPPACSTWSFELPEGLEFLWNVIPGGQIDPAVLVEYVRQGYRAGQPRVLWDYNMSITGAADSFFVLSQVPATITSALNGSPVFAGRDAAKDIIKELAEIGLAVGSESMRSGTKALGVIGVIAATRLLSDHGGGPTPLRNNDASRGVLLPVDSFKQVLGDGLDDASDVDGRRADLIACQLDLVGGSALRISFAAIECKYTARALTDEYLDGGLQQAQRTYDRLLRLAEAARFPSGIPERLALVSLISFGLRLRAATEDDALRIEHEILRLLLNGEFEIGAPLAGSVVVATECERSSASIVRRDGLIVRVAPGHWPGVSESPALHEVRVELSRLFSISPAAAAGTPPLPLMEATPAPQRAGEPAATSLASPAAVTPLVPPVISSSLPRLLPLLLGTGTGRTAVYYDPQSERRPLDNYNMMISGSSGKGKTQLIKSLVAQLRLQGRNVVLLDFKNDFASDRTFLALSGLDCRYVTFDGLPYNPLIPMPVTHPATGKAALQVSQHITGIAAVLGKTFGLGTQQESALKDVIRECFRERGFDPSRTVEYDPASDFPDFNDVGANLREANPLAYNRMDPLFDLGVFSSANRNVNFEAILRTSSVVDLSQIQSDTIKNAIAKILVLSAHAYYNARPHSGVLRQFFVFDEAHRVLDTEFMVRFVRECRAYGVGILLSSQYPKDFTPEVSASLNTKILHGNGAERDQVRDIARVLGSKAGDSVFAQLGMFEAFVSNPHYEAIEIKTLAYPHYLVLCALRATNGVRRKDLRVEGVDEARLSLDLLLESLLKMGLAEDENGVIRARDVNS